MTLTRAFSSEVITDNVGTVQQGATVAVRDPGTVNLIGETIYSAATGGGTLSNPLTTDSQGIVKFWLAAPKTVDLFITAPGIASFTRSNVFVLGTPEQHIYTEGTQSIAGPIAIDGLSVTNGVWTGGTITSPTISGPTITGNVPGMTFSDNLVWGSGYGGDVVQSLENAYDAALGTQGESTATVLGVQRGSAASVATPSNNQNLENWQTYINPNATAGATGSTWYRYGRRIGAGNMYAWYADLVFIWADNTTTDYNSGSDNVASGGIARNTSARPARIWGGYYEARAYSLTASAVGIEADVWNASQGKAGMPWAADVNRLAGLQVVGNAQDLYSASIRGSRYHTGGLMLFSAEEGQTTAQRSAFRVGIHARADSIRKTGSDAALITALEARYAGTGGLHGAAEDSAGYLIHGAAMDPTSRFGLMQHGGALWAAVNGWTSASAYSTELPLIGTEAGNNDTYLYSAGVLRVLSAPLGTTWATISAGEMAQYAGQFSLYNVSGANYERAAVSWASNVMRWSMEKGGTGTAREQRWATAGTDLLSLGTGGILSTMNSRRGQFKQPATVVSKTAFSHPVGSSGSFLAVTFDTERIDQDGNGSAVALHDNVTNSDRLVPPIAGVYLLDAFAQWDLNGAGVRIVELRHVTSGGTETVIQSVGPVVGDAGVNVRQPAARVYSAASGDYFRVYVFQSSAATRTVDVQASLTYLSD